MTKSRGTKKTGWLVALVCAAGLNMACSTPPTPSRERDEASTAFDAYRECMARLGGTSRANECNSVGTADSRGLSYYHYLGNSGSTDMYGPTAGGSNFGSLPTGSVGGYGGSGGPTMRSVKSHQLDQAYETYLNELDEATQAELIARWQALANSNP
jgi:hypothetical protein